MLKAQADKHHTLLYMAKGLWIPDHTHMYLFIISFQISSPLCCYSNLLERLSTSFWSVTIWI